MALPEYSEIEEPLLNLLLMSGGNGITSKQAYVYLAERFRLTQQDLAEITKDGRAEPLWNNMVRWARRKLNDAGYIDRTAPHGVWRLSADGIRAARER